jgi:hypothetical protein
MFFQRHAYRNTRHGLSEAACAKEARKAGPFGQISYWICRTFSSSSAALIISSLVPVAGRPKAWSLRFFVRLRWLLRSLGTGVAEGGERDN